LFEKKNYFFFYKKKKKKKKKKKEKKIIFTFFPFKQVMENSSNQNFDENLLYESIKENNNINLNEEEVNMDNLIPPNGLVEEFVNNLVEGIANPDGNYNNMHNNENNNNNNNGGFSKAAEASKDQNSSSNLVTNLNDGNGYESNNLINYSNDPVVINKPLTRPTTHTVTRTTTRYVAPTNANRNNNNRYNNNGYNNNGYNNQNVNTPNRNIPNKGNLNRGNQETANRNIPYQGTINRVPINQNIPNQAVNPNNNNSAINQNQNININNQNLNSNQENNSGTAINGNGQLNDNPVPEFVPNANAYGYASTSNDNISEDIQKVQNDATPENKTSRGGGSTFTFIIILIIIPIIIILIIAAIFFVKKYKKGKRGSNIVYPDDKIRKSNLFGTLQFWNSNKINRVSVSTGSRGSRTNLTSISNDREDINTSNVPEYSEWLEAGSNTMSMPPVSPPPLVTDGKINGLTNPNYAMDTNIDMNRNSALGNTQLNKPPMAKNAWKLEGMRIKRERELTSNLEESHKESN